MNKSLRFIVTTILVVFFTMNLHAQRIGFDKSKSIAGGNKAINSIIIDTISSQGIINMFFGPGVIINNFSITGAPVAIGKFIDTSGTLGIDTGLIITSGSIYNVPGPNVNGASGTANGTSGDTDLDSLVSPFTTFDAAVIEFDFTPQADTIIAAEMVFASEEYPEFAGSSFNDVFAFFCSGPGFNGLENIAYIPGTSTVVSINNVNATTNNSFYIDNTGGLVLEYDGYTTPLPFAHSIQVGQTYHFKIAIADVADGVFDSGVFLKKQSFRGHAKMPVPDFSYVLNGLDISLTNTSSSAQTYTWDLGDGTVIHDSTGQPLQHTYTSTGNYDITLTAHNYFQSDFSMQSISIIGVGLESYDKAPALIVQNVSEGVFRLSGREIKELRVLSVTGQEFSSSSFYRNGTLDITSLPRGIYIIVYDGGAVKVMR